MRFENHWFDYQRVYDDRNACACMYACTWLCGDRVTVMARATSVQCEKAFIEEVYGDYFLIYMEEDARVLKNFRGRWRGRRYIRPTVIGRRPVALYAFLCEKDGEKFHGNDHIVRVSRNKSLQCVTRRVRMV